MDSGALITQLVVALAAVLAVMGALTWLARRLRLPQTQGSQLAVKASLNLGQREKLVLIQFGEEQLLLGVTAGSIQALATRDMPADWANAEAQEAA